MFAGRQQEAGGSWYLYNGMKLLSLLLWFLQEAAREGAAWDGQGCVSGLRTSVTGVGAASFGVVRDFRWFELGKSRILCHLDKLMVA